MKIIYAHLKENTTIPGVFASDAFLSDSKFPGIQMELEGGLLVVNYKNRRALFPVSNVRVLLCAPAENSVEERTSGNPDETKPKKSKARAA